jgi:V/A-type H+-transporting ATPase subunit F
MARIVALGPAEDALPYAAMGAELRETAAAGELGAALDELARDPSLALVLVPESQAAEAVEEIEGFRSRSRAALLVLPVSTGAEGLALAEMKTFLEHAIGVDLITKG